jgi:hypothetical protein
MSRTARKDPDEIPFAPIPHTHATYATEMDIELARLGIAASKAASQIMEELGSGCSPSGTNDDSDTDSADPHETIEDVRDVLIRGEDLSRVCWGSNAMNNRKYYIVDEGHHVTVKPKDSTQDVNSPSVLRVKAFLDDWMTENNWYSRQADISERLDKHGEAFDLLHYQSDGMLKTYIAEPYDLDDDPDSKFKDSEDSDLEFYDKFGVRRTNDIRFRPVSYFIDGDWYNDLSYYTTKKTLPDRSQLAESLEMLVQHRKRNVSASKTRGLTLFWPVRDELTWSKRLLSNLMRVSSFQAAFGAIRTISDIHGADAVKSYLATMQGGTGSSGQQEQFNFPAAAVVTKPKGISYEFPETGLGASNHIEVLVQLLRACASGMRLPEFMLTANVSEGNFASTLVSEGPFHKGMRFEQNQMVDEDLRIIYQALRWAAQSGKHTLTMEDVDAVVIEVKKPRVQTRNRQEDFEVNQKLWESSLLSGKDHLGAEGQDYDSQQAQIEKERKEESDPPKSIMITMGPAPGIGGDPLKEKGVSKGKPAEDPTKQ